MRRRSALSGGGGGWQLLPRPPFCCCGSWEPARAKPAWRRDASWSSVLGVAAGVGVKPWGCGAGAFQAWSEWRTAPQYVGRSENPGAASAAVRLRPPRPRALVRIPKPAPSVRRPRSRRAKAEDAAGPEPRGRCRLGPLSAPRGVPRGPSSFPKPSAGQRRPEQGRAAAAPTRPRASARHHVLRQVRLLRPLLLVHGAGVSPGGADPAPGPAPRHVPRPRLLHLPRGLCAVGVRELSSLPLHHQLTAQPPF